jgi:hypothetical protein
VTIDDTATQVTVTSVGVCTTSINISVSGITTSTTTLAVTSFTLGYDNSNFFTSCTNYTSSPQTFYSTVGSTLIEGTILYDDIGLTSLSSNGYYSDGTNWWRITSGDGVIYSTGACATTTTTSTTTTVAPTTTSTTTTLAPTTTTSTSTTTLANAVFSLGYDASVGWQSCYATQTTYYSYAGDIVQNGTYLFTDITLSTKAPVGYYSDGANYYYVASTCNEYTFTNNLGYDESVTYYDCSGAPQTLLVYDGTTSSAVCVDSIINLNGLTDNNNGLGSCTPNSIGILQGATPCPTTSTTSTTSTSTSTTSTSTTSTSTSTTSTSTSTTSTSTTTTEAPTTTSTTTSGGGGTTSTSTTSTSTSTTTAAGPCQVSLSPSNVDGPTACDNWNNVIDRTTYYALYSGCSATNGQQLYTDSGLTTLIPNGWYSNGTNYFQVVGGNGTLTNSTACTGATTTTTTTQPPTTTTTTTQPPTTTTTTTQPPTTSTTTTTTTEPPTTTTTTTTESEAAAPSVDTCSGQANLAIYNNANAVSLGYTDPVGPGGNLLAVCTIGGSPLGKGSSDSFIGVFAPSYSTQLSGANGKKLRTWLNGTLFSTINITSSPITVSGDAAFGSGDLVILEVVN